MFSNGMDFGYFKFEDDADSVVYYFDDKVFVNKSRALQGNSYKLKYSCPTNNITYFGGNTDDWKFTSKIVDSEVPAHYMSTYSFKHYKITFECTRFSKLSKKELMKELWVSYQNDVI